MVEPHDSPEIADPDLLIRRIDPIEHLATDDRGNSRISSKAFKPSSRPPFGLSIDVKKLIERAGLRPEVFVTTPKFLGSVEFPASVVRSADLMVGLDPLSENLFHGEVWGKVRPDRFSASQERALMRGCAWLVPLPGVRIVPQNP